MKRLNLVLIAVLLVSGLVLPFATPISVQAAEITFNATESDAYWAYESGFNANSQVAWDEVHDDTTQPPITGTNGVRILIGCLISSGDYAFEVERAVVYFDTSSLPDDCNITNAILKIYSTGEFSDDISSWRLQIQSGMPTYPHDPPVSGDYYYDHYSGSGGVLNSSGMSGTGYKSITLNTTGLGWISKTGTTKFMLRDATYDIADSVPSGGNGVTNRWGFYTYENGAGYYPQLVITYESTETPTITTNNATYVTMTTARLNSLLDDDGGEACGVRFQYGTDTGNYTVNTTWINDTYHTTDTPYVDLTGLTPNTTYYFRAQANNTQGTVSGGELNFTTPAESADPTNLTAYPSSHSISLTWTKGVNTTNTLVRGQIGAYPEINFEWISPTGFNDPDSNWTDEAFAYDDNVNTTARCWNAGNSWGGYLELTHATVNCNAIRFNARESTSPDWKLVDIDVHYTADNATTWHDVYNGTYSSRIWEEKSLNGTQAIDKARIRFYFDGVPPGGYHIALYEFDFGTVGNPSTATGELVYNGTMSTATHTGLLPGTTYYYRAWGESGGNYTANYTSAMATTTAGAGAGDDPTAPTMPSAWYGAPDHTRLAGVPFYSMVNDMADEYGMPPTNFWLLLFLFGATLMGIFIYAISHSAVGSIMASGVTLVILLNSLGGLLWIMFAVGIIATGIFMAVRQT